MQKEHRSKLLWELTVRRSEGAKKNSDSPAMSMSSMEEEEEEAGCEEVERLFSNGDFYTGQWMDNFPHGTGRYLWTDGCMYEGDWCRGKTMGTGKFSWPSGATYDGDFKTGFMDGYGTYIGANGDTFKGFWVKNLKHGKGRKNYVNGDYYEGEWRCGVQDGQGKYIWRNGNEYEGEWKNGAISAKGSLLWANGNRYIGMWGDGLPKGEGRFLWVDGSFYMGNWSADPNEQTGTYYPSSVGPPKNRDWSPEVVFAVDLKDCKICNAEAITIFPSQKTLNWTGVEVDFSHRLFASQPGKAAADSTTRPKWKRSIDFARKSSRGGEKGSDRAGGWETDGELGCDRDNDDCLAPLRYSDVDAMRIRIQQLKGQMKEMKKQGDTISKAHKNYDLMLNLQLGIRHSVARPGPTSSLDLKASAFDPKEKVWTRFPPEGSKHTPPHQSCDFRWKDYCPLVFRTLRKLFNIDPGDYMISICGNDALRELSSPGKSGSFFYLTNDDRYMIKTMKKSEVKVLLRMLPAYYNHVRSFENTLVTKFFGLHCVKLTGATQKKVRFVIMGNLFCSEYVIHRRYDLKGSSHGRTTDKPEAEIDENTTLKDLDLNFIIRLQKAWFHEFQRQVERDCEFLEQERIMDYSLLVGLHFRDTEGDGDPDLSDAEPRLSKADMDHLLCDPTRWASMRLGINMPARVEQTVRRVDCETQLFGEPTGEFYDVVLFFGIIDILQDYDISKKLEHAYKSFQYDATSISAVDPKLYAKRFRDFIFKAFSEDF